jgi:hypothetical protein
MQAEELPDRIEAAIAQASTLLHEPSKRPVLGWKGEYVRARMVLEADRQVSRLADGQGYVGAPLSLLFPGSAVTGIQVTKASVEAAKKAVQQLGSQHYGDDPPDLSDPQCMEGFVQWIASAVYAQEQELLKVLAHNRFACLLVERLKGSPTALKKALRQKQLTWQRATAQHKVLREWASWAVQLDLGPVQVVQWHHQLQHRLQHLATATTEQLTSSSWAAAIGASVSGSAVEQAALKVHLLRNMASRLEEELALLGDEQQQLRRTLHSRLHALSAALSAPLSGGPPSADEVQPGLGLGTACTAADGAAVGRRLVLLQERARVERSLADAERFLGALQQENSAEAASPHTAAATTTAAAAVLAEAAAAVADLEAVDDGDAEGALDEAE